METASVKQVQVVAAIACHAVLVPLASAQEFTLLASQREMRTAVEGWMADGSGWYVNTVDGESFSSTNFGGVDSEVSASIGHISFASGLAKQKSNISSASLGGIGEIRSSAFSMGLNAPASSLCTSSYIVDFAVNTPMEVLLTGDVWVSSLVIPPDLHNFAVAVVKLTSLQSGVMHSISVTTPGASDSLLASFTLLPGQYRMEAHASTQLFTTSGAEPLSLGSQFNFDLRSSRRHALWV